MATEFYLLSIQGSLNGQYNESVQCFQGVGTSPTDTLDAGLDLIGAWIASLATHWLAALPQTYFLDRLAARRAFPKPSATAHNQFAAFSTSGTFSANAASYNLCPVVLLIPPSPTKTQGKVFMPACPIGGVTNNALGATYRTALDAYFNPAIVGVTGSLATWTLSVYSRRNASAVPVVQASHSLKIGFQGRRRRPVGSA